MDLCERYSKRAVEERSKLNDVAPKDVKQLEGLKPIKTPSMGERYKNSIEKEKRLEAASRPRQKTKEDNKEANVNAEEGKQNKRKKKNKKKAETSAPVAADDSALDQEDEVEEGINWSDDE